MKSTGRAPHALPTLELEVGEEIVEVRIEADGIHFCHPHGTETRGHLSWDVAIAMSLLPDSLKRAAPA